MVTYTFSAGYSAQHSDARVFSQLVSVICAAETWQAVTYEVLRLDPDVDQVILDELVDPATYKDGLWGIKVVMASGWNGGAYVSLSAPGGGAVRDIREACLRALCRVVLAAMHKQRMDVCINVT